MLTKPIIVKVVVHYFSEAWKKKKTSQHKIETFFGQRIYSFSKTWTLCKKHKQWKVNLLRNALFFVILNISIIHDSLNRHLIILLLYMFFNNFPLQWNVCSFSLVGLHRMSGEIKGEKQKENTLIYFRKYFLRCLYSYLGLTQKPSNRNMLYQQWQAALKSAGSFLKWGRQLSAHIYSMMAASLIFARLLWTRPCQACAFHSLGLFMTGRGVSYYGAYVCTAHCLPVIKARVYRYGITAQQTRDADRNPSTPWVKLHRILPNRQKPTNTSFLPRLAEKLLRNVIF